MKLMRLIPRFLRGEVYVRKVDPAAYVRKDSPLGDSEWMEDLDGVDWFYADVPPWLHKCWPQSRGWLNRELVERCACGSLRFDGHGPWIDRNSRKPMTAEERAEREQAKIRDGLIRAWEAAYKAEDWTRVNEIRSELRQLDG